MSIDPDNEAILSDLRLLREFDFDSLDIRVLENLIRTIEESLVKHGDVLRVDGKLVSQDLAEQKQKLKELKELKEATAKARRANT
jgi:hypothetical protein